MSGSYWQQRFFEGGTIFISPNWHLCRFGDQGISPRASIFRILFNFSFSISRARACNALETETSASRFVIFRRFVCSFLDAFNFLPQHVWKVRYICGNSTHISYLLWLYVFSYEFKKAKTIFTVRKSFIILRTFHIVWVLGFFPDFESFLKEEKTLVPIFSVFVHKI